MSYCYSNKLAHHEYHEDDLQRSGISKSKYILLKTNSSLDIAIC